MWLVCCGRGLCVVGVACMLWACHVYVFRLKAQGSATRADAKGMVETVLDELFARYSKNHSSTYY